MVITMMLKTKSIILIILRLSCGIFISAKAKIIQELTYVLSLGGIIGLNGYITTDGIDMNVKYALIAAVILLTAGAEYSLIIYDNNSLFCGRSVSVGVSFCCIKKQDKILPEPKEKTAYLVSSLVVQCVSYNCVKFLTRLNLCDTINL